MREEHTDPDQPAPGRTDREQEGRWRTESRETAYRCPGFSIVHETVRLPDGTRTDFDYLQEEPSVVVIPFTPAGELVLIEEWRQAVKGFTRGFPAGGMEAEEDVTAAARRELEEETGYVAEQLRVLDSFEPANGFADALFHYVVATGCRPAGEQRLDPDETITVRTGRLEELLDRLHSGELRDGRTALGLLRYAIEVLDPTVGPEGVRPPAQNDGQ